MSTFPNSRFDDDGAVREHEGDPLADEARCSQSSIREAALDPDAGLEVRVHR